MSGQSGEQKQGDSGEDEMESKAKTDRMGEADDDSDKGNVILADGSDTESNITSFTDVSDADRVIFVQDSDEDVMESKAKNIRLGEADGDSDKGNMILMDGSDTESNIIRAMDVFGADPIVEDTLTTRRSACIIVQGDLNVGRSSVRISGRGVRGVNVRESSVGVMNHGTIRTFDISDSAISSIDVSKNEARQENGDLQESGASKPFEQLTDFPTDLGWIQLTGTIAMNNIEPIQPGKDVYQALKKHVSGKKEKLAVKLLKKSSCDFKEVDILLTLADHPNIVKIIDSGSCDGMVPQIFIAMEYCPHNLYEYIENYPFHLVKATTFFEQTVCAIAFIHDHKIAHRDLKPSNILITIGNSSIKVADFGICKQIPGDQSQASVSNPRAGTEGFKAPETYEHGIKRLGYKADIFPLGICGYYTVTHGNHPFGPNKYKWAGNILDDKHRDLSLVPHFLDDHKRSQLISLLQCMLKFNPKDRPTAQQAQNDIFFEELHRSFEPQSSGGHTTFEPEYPTESPSSQVEQNAIPDGISEESEMPSSTDMPRGTNHKQVSSTEVSRAAEHNQTPIEENPRIVDTDSAPFPSGGDLARLQEQEENSGFVPCTSDFDPAGSPDQRSSSRSGHSFEEPQCVHSDNPDGDDCLLVKNQIFHNEEQLLIYCLFWIDDADHSSEFESHSKSCPVEFHACACDTIHFTVSTKSDEYSINEKSELEEFLKLSFFKTTNNDQIKRKIFQFRVDPGPSKIEDKHIEIDYHVRVESQKTQGVYIRFNNLGKHEHIGQVCKLCRKMTNCSPSPVDKSVHNYYGDYSKTAMNMADNGGKMEMGGDKNKSILQVKAKSGTG